MFPWDQFLAPQELLFIKEKENRFLSLFNWGGFAAKISKIKKKLFFLIFAAKLQKYPQLFVVFFSFKRKNILQKYKNQNVVWFNFGCCARSSKNIKNKQKFFFFLILAKIFFAKISKINKKSFFFNFGGKAAKISKRKQILFVFKKFWQKSFFFFPKYPK